MPNRRLIFGALVAAGLAACSSPDWTRTVVDDGGGMDAGRNPAMALHVEGSTQQLAVAYEGESGYKLELAQRTGNAQGWGGWTRDTIREGGARKPEITLSPDGDIYIAFINREAPQTGTIYVASQSGMGFPCYIGQNTGWTCEPIYSGIVVSDRLATLYEPRAGLPDRIHVMWSIDGSRELWHAFRTVDSDTWSKIRVGGGVGNPDFNAQEGDRPVAGLTDTGGVLLYYTAKTGQFPADRPLRAHSFGGISSWSTETWPKFKPGFDHYDVVLNTDPALSSLDAYWYARGTCEEGTLRLYSEDSYLDNAGAPTKAPFVAPENIDACTPDLAIDENGFVYAATYRRRMGGLDIYRYNAALGAWSGDWYTIIDNSAVEVGLGPRLVYSPLSGELMVVYYDKSNGRLKLATRNVN